MTGINTYSTTAASNVNANTGITMDEGMSPAVLNNSIRQIMADLRAEANDLIWFKYGSGDSPVVAATYVGATQFKIAGVDVSTPYHVGRRVKATGSSTGTIYGSISAVSFSTDTTVTVTWDSGSLSNETLTVYLSQIPVTGFPGMGGVFLAANPGYFYLGPFLIQWGITGSTSSPETITMSKAYSGTSAYSVVATLDGAGGLGASCNPTSSTQFQIYKGGSALARWIAIGTY